jgi:uncharacterized protein with PhoU and TrkA domain
MTRKEELEELKRMLTDLKNTSELMINLAYSALILNSKEVAEEVERLEEYIDDLHTKFELLSLSLQRSPEESEEFLSLMRIGSAVERIADAALQMVEAVLKGLQPHPIFPLVVEETEETITKVQVLRDSVLIGKELGELIDKLGQKVIAIYSKGRWIYNPRRDVAILPGDVLIVRGYAETRERLEKLASAELREL